MILLRLFDQVSICGSRLAAATLLATLVLSACAPKENSVTATLQSASDWLNDVDPPPPAPEWRLSKQPGLEDRPFPKLSDVPPRPDGLATPEAVTATIDSLRDDNARAGTDRTERPGGTELGGPEAPRVERLMIPGVGWIGR